MMPAVRCRVHITIEASLAIATGFNLFCVTIAVIYIITLKVDPEDFRWLQPKPKDSKDGGDAKVCIYASGICACLPWLKEPAAM